MTSVASVERFRRVCPRHCAELSWRETQHPHEGFPNQRAWCSAGGGHACPTWAVYDVVRCQLVALGNRDHVTLLDGWAPLAGFVLPELLAAPPRRWGRADRKRSRTP